MSKHKDWYEDGLEFSCTQCGNCCSGPPGYVWYNLEEEAQMAEYLELDIKEFRRLYARKEMGKWTLDEVKRNGKYDCIFLKRDKNGKALCSIYPVRPTQCKTWPFWRENLASPSSWLDASKKCPGMKFGGKFYSADKVRIIRDKNNESN